MPIIDVTPGLIAAGNAGASFAQQVRKMALENTRERLDINQDNRAERGLRSDLKSAQQLRTLRQSEEQRNQRASAQALRLNDTQEQRAASAFEQNQATRQQARQAQMRAAESFLKVVPPSLREDVSGQIGELSGITDPQAFELAFEAVRENVKAATVQIQRQGLMDEITRGMAGGQFSVLEPGADGKPSQMDAEIQQRLQAMLEGLQRGVANPDEISQALTMLRSEVSSIRKQDIMQRNVISLLDGAIAEAQGTANFDAMGEYIGLQADFASGVLRDPREALKRLSEIRTGARVPSKVMVGAREVQDHSGFSRPPSPGAPTSRMTAAQRSELMGQAREDAAGLMENISRAMGKDSPFLSAQEAEQWLEQKTMEVFAEAAQSYGWSSDVELQSYAEKALGVSQPVERTQEQTLRELERVGSDFAAKYGDKVKQLEGGQVDIPDEAWNEAQQQARALGVSPEQLIYYLLQPQSKSTVSTDPMSIDMKR